MTEDPDFEASARRPNHALAYGIAAFAVTLGSTAALMAAGATPGPTRGITSVERGRVAAVTAPHRVASPVGHDMSPSPSEETATIAEEAPGAVETPGEAVSLSARPAPPTSASASPRTSTATTPASTTATPGKSTSPAPSRTQFATARNTTSAAPRPAPAPARSTARPAPAPKPTTPPPDASGISSGGDYGKIADGINAERVRAGLPALAYSDTLEKSAIACSISNAKNTNGRTIMLSHSLPGCGYEDLFMSPWAYPTAEQVVSTWMNSPGHRAAIMNRNTRTIAIGYAWRSGYGFVVAGAFK